MKKHCPNGWNSEIVIMSREERSEFIFSTNFPYNIVKSIYFN